MSILEVRGLKAWVHAEKTAKTAKGQRECHFQVGRLHLFEGIKREKATAPAQMAFLRRLSVRLSLPLIIFFPGGAMQEPTNPCRRLRRHGPIPRSGKPPGGGNDNPLQYSCMENSKDRGAWWATVHGVEKSWTWLSKFTLYAEGRGSIPGQGAKIPHASWSKNQNIKQK